MVQGATPNLTLYEGTNSVNSYTYNTSTHVLDVTNSVQNNGDASAGSFRIGWYLSTNTIISTGDNLVCNVTQSSLTNGFFINKSCTVDLDDVSGLPSGTYYVGVYFDDLADVAESDETDNTAYFSSTIDYEGAPNLTLYSGASSINSFTYDGSSHDLDVTNSVQNNGDASAGSFRIGWYLSTNTIISTGDNLVCNVTQSSLTNGFFINKSCTVDLDDVSGLPSGTYYVGVYFDDLADVAESDETDNTAYFSSPTVEYMIIGVEEFVYAIPDEFLLEQNHPNPFNPMTLITYALPRSSKVSLVIYDLRGNAVAHLIDDEQRSGYHTIRWNASGIASGIYFYRLQAGEFVQSRKMLLLK